jgi:hypothetical protein
MTASALGKNRRHFRISLRWRVMIVTELSSVLCSWVQSWFTDRQKILVGRRQAPATWVLGPVRPVSATRMARHIPKSVTSRQTMVNRRASISVSLNAAQNAEARLNRL